MDEICARKYGENGQILEHKKDSKLFQNRPKIQSKYG